MVDQQKHIPQCATIWYREGIFYHGTPRSTLYCSMVARNNHIFLDGTVASTVYTVLARSTEVYTAVSSFDTLSVVPVERVESVRSSL